MKNLRQGNGTAHLTSWTAFAVLAFGCQGILGIDDPVLDNAFLRDGGANQNGDDTGGVTSAGGSKASGGTKSAGGRLSGGGLTSAGGFPFGAGGTGATGSFGGAGGGSPYCGNNVIDPNEECDAGNLGGGTCATVTLGARPLGLLRCTVSCRFDTSGCTTAGTGGAVGAGGATGYINGSNCNVAEQCLPDSTCWGNKCCVPPKGSCGGGGDCCPFEQCQAGTCCKVYRVVCVEGIECCSGGCTAGLCD